MRSVYLFVLIIFGSVLTGFSQRNNDQGIQDSVIGWWTNNRFDHLKLQNDELWKKKQAVVNDFVKWTKASYTPVGGLGTSSRYINSKGFGVNFLIWNVSHDKEWTEPNGNFKPIAEENTKFFIAANQLFGAFPISFINTGKDYYFTIQPDGYADNKEVAERRKGMDPRIHPNAYKYITRVNDWCTVYLAPENKLPWTLVSRGELLQKAEEGLQKVLADKRKQVASQWPDNKKTQDEVLDNFEKVEIGKYRKKIQDLQKRYAASLNEKAVITDMQPDIHSFETDPDLFKTDSFEKDLNHAYEVYKVDAATMSGFNDVTPKWIAVAFPFQGKQDGSKLYEMFTAMSQNINYDYIYNYFYDPEKVKGKTYAPANASELKVRLNTYRLKTADKQNAIAEKQKNMPSNVILFDDFSNEKIGSEPAGWHINSVGKPHAVSKIQGEDGNWLKLGYGNQISSKLLKTLPENFSLEYDIVTSVFDGRWGANISMEIKGSKKGSDGIQYASVIRTSITAGNQSALEANHDYRGELKADLINTPSQMDYNDKGGYLNYAQPVFTNTNRKVHVQVLKKNELLAIFLNGKQIADAAQFKTKYGKPCGDCSIPAGLVFNSFVINNFTQEPDTVDCYVGNIKITRL